MLGHSAWTSTWSESAAGAPWPAATSSSRAGFGKGSRARDCRSHRGGGRGPRARFTSGGRGPWDLCPSAGRRRVGAEGCEHRRRGAVPPATRGHGRAPAVLAQLREDCAAPPGPSERTAAVAAAAPSSPAAAATATTTTAAAVSLAGSRLARRSPPVRP